MNCALNSRYTFQCVSNFNAKFEYKGIKTFEVTDYTNLAPQKCCRLTNGWIDYY